MTINLKYTYSVGVLLGLIPEHDSLCEAGTFVRTLETRQGLKVGCPEEVAWRNGWIDSNKLEDLAMGMSKSGYGNYLLKLLEKKRVINI